MSESTFNKETNIIERCTGNKNIVDSLGYISILDGNIIKNSGIKIHQEMINKVDDNF